MNFALAVSWVFGAAWPHIGGRKGGVCSVPLLFSAASFACAPSLAYLLLYGFNAQHSPN
jgi:hypothetical protein